MLVFLFKDFFIVKYLAKVPNPQIKAAALKFAAFVDLLAFVVKVNCSLKVVNKTS